MGFLEFLSDFLQRSGFFIGGFFVMLIGAAILYSSSLGFLVIILGLAMMAYAGRSRS